MDDEQKKILTFCRDRIQNHLVFMRNNNIISQDKLKRVMDILYQQ
jgi:hypothetical protein